MLFIYYSPYQLNVKQQNYLKPSFFHFFFNKKGISPNKTISQIFNAERNEPAINYQKFLDTKKSQSYLYFLAINLLRKPKMIFFYYKYFHCKRMSICLQYTK